MKPAGRSWLRMNRCLSKKKLVRLGACSAGLGHVTRYNLCWHVPVGAKATSNRSSTSFCSLSIVQSCLHQSTYNSLPRYTNRTTANCPKMNPVGSPDARHHAGVQSNCFFSSRNSLGYSTPRKCYKQSVENEVVHKAPLRRRATLANQELVVLSTPLSLSVSSSPALSARLLSSNAPCSWQPAHQPAVRPRPPRFAQLGAVKIHHRLPHRPQTDLS